VADDTSGNKVDVGSLRGFPWGFIRLHTLGTDVPAHSVGRIRVEEIARKEPRRQRETGQGTLRCQCLQGEGWVCSALTRRLANLRSCVWRVGASRRKPAVAVPMARRECGMNLEFVEEVLERHPEVEGNLISILHEVQSHYHYLPKAALVHLAKRTGIPITRLHSIATFYHFFSLKPKGRHQIHVCLGTACHVKGGQRVLDDLARRLGIAPGEVTPDMEYSVDTVRCVGACSFAPVVAVGDQTYGGVTPKKVSEILKQHKAVS